MTTIRTTLVKQALILCMLLVAHSLIPHPADAAWIRAISSNFDLHNFTDRDVNDVEVTLAGISANDIVSLYAGKFAREWTPHTEEEAREVTITWSAPGGTFLKPCEWLHLGVSLRAGAPAVEYAMATWTADGEPVGTIAFVWQNWVGYGDSSVGDIILPPIAFPVVPGTTQPDTITVERRWAASTTVIPLNSLTQNDPMVARLDWSQETKTDKFSMLSAPSELIIPPSADDIEAIVVQYTVTPGSSDTYTALFTNQAHIVHDPAPQPRLLKPVDNVGQRPDMVYGPVDLWATEATGLWDDHIIVTRFDFSSDDGKTWNPIAEVDDGTVETEATLPGAYRHNWWHGSWDASQYPEGWYLVKATMIDWDDNIGENIIQVYVDPTPPIPVMENLNDHQVFIDQTELSATTLDEDIVTVTWEIQLKPLYYTKGLPHLDQHDYGVGQTNNGNMYCAPTASASCLKWWAAHGYPELTQALNGNPLTDTQLVEGLAGAMDTHSVHGTATADIVKGLRDWIAARALLLTVTGPSAVTPTAVRNEVENCKEDVLIAINWNTGGWHRVAVNSIANFTNFDGTTDVDIMDPGPGGIVYLTMDNDGKISYPGKDGVHVTARMITVSPLIHRIPWIHIGDGASIIWSPDKFPPGLYFLKVTMTDSIGNQGWSQIVARVGQPDLPVLLFEPWISPDTGLLNLMWRETDPSAGPFGYTVQWMDNPAKGWQTAPGQWPSYQPWWAGDITGVRWRLYRVKKQQWR